MRAEADALNNAARTFTGEQWRELFRRSKGWPHDRWALLYPAYLQSRAWNTKRMARHEIDGFTCMECGGGTRQGVTLQCHHLTYERIGDEDVKEDLITLCTMCHKVEHDRGIKPFRYHLQLAMDDISEAVVRSVATPLIAT